VIAKRVLQQRRTEWSLDLGIDIDYRAEKGRHGPRRVEPYSLILFVVNDHVALRSYRVDRILLRCTS
jgi:predicted DNA-binding transcriptional regulator YafY